MPGSPTSTLQQAVPLDPMQIERTLDSLWRDYRAREGASLAARARLANLIVYCRTREEADAASAAVVSLNQVRPVRSISVLAEEGGDAAPEAGASLQCGVTGSSHICYEEIKLHTPGNARRMLPSLIEALTIPDLPVYLWFAGDPRLDDPAMESLLSAADRVVTDSHTFADPLSRFRQIARLVDRMRGQTVFTEFTWTRIGVWREAVGKLFDPMPSREFLPRITDVVITSVDSGGVPSDRAILMAGWLAARLRWTPEGAPQGSPGTIRFRSPTGPVTVSWREGPGTARGHLLGVEMTAGEVSFRVMRVHGDPAGAIRSSIVCSGDEQDGPAYNPLNWRIHELLCNALEIRTPFTDWEDALAAIAAMEG